MVEVARMGSESTVWSFIRTFRKHWFAAMSGGVSVPFAAAPAFIDNGYAQIVLALLALTAAWFAHIAYGKRREIRSSRFKTGCRAKSDYFCTPTKLERREELKLVKAAAGRNCRIRIEHRATPSDEFTEVWGESQVVPWSRQFGKPDLSKGNPLRFNIVSYNPTTPIPEDIVERAQQSNSLVQFYESKGRNGEYRYTVHVVGRDVLPAMAHVFVMWNPHGYPSVTLHPIEVA